MAQLAEQLICNQQVIGSSPIIGLTLLKRNFNIAGWSSLEARRAHNPKVAGSNPAPAIFLCNEKCTDKNIEVKNMLACFLTDIFLDVYGECRKRKTAGLELSHFGLKKATSKLLIRIKSNNHYAQIAQLVEQRTENPRVTGSIPVLGIFLYD